jgi:nicotinamide-nucleotide amidase
MLAEIITIGDEILIGQIVDTNSAWMAQTLNNIGIRVKQISSVSDDEQHIMDALELAESRAEIILITGGLGPTKDDITKKTLAKYFNMGFRRDEETLQQVSSIFEKANRPMIELNRMQADVPDGCVVVPNRNGTAPGMWFNEHGKIFVSMPGVPYEMMYMMEEEVLPRLKTSLNLPFIYHKTILTAGIGESFLAVRISEIEAALPEYIKLAYLPKLGQVRLRLSGSSRDEQQLHTDINHYSKLIADEIREFVVVEDDIPLEKAVVDIMKSRSLSLSTAESCTGGYIAHLLTKHAGSSAVFSGGAVTYSNALKMAVLGVKADTLLEYGAVSEQTVKEMALGALQQFHTDYAISVSGIAGPDGGTPDKPVGTVWIAVASAHAVEARKFTFGNKRTQNIERAAASALTLLLSRLKLDHQ